MNVLKSCLMIVGLLAVLLVGGCIMGAYSLGSALNGMVNPKEFTKTVDQNPDKVRSKLYHFLKSASDESTTKPVAVNPFSDGSVRLTYGNAAPYDLNVVIEVSPQGDGKSSKAHASWEAADFATGSGVPLDAVNRAINQRVSTALNDIDNGREITTTMLLSDVVDAAKHDKLKSNDR